MLWACAHFPRLPMEALSRGAPEHTPLAVASADTRPRVIAANLAAIQAGVRPGMPVSAALALAPGLTVQPRSRTLEEQTLAEIAQWALQFTPTPCPGGASAVLLEIGAGLKLFGGLPILEANLRNGLAMLGVTAVVAIAPTPTAALMLASAREACTLTDPAQLAAALASLPVAATGCAGDILETLEDLGVHTVGALIELPRDGLARRFGQALLDTLDRAFGRLADPRRPFALPEQFHAHLALPAPAHEVEALAFGTQRLAVMLCGWLQGRGLGAMRLRLDLIHEDCRSSQIRLQLSSPGRDPTRLGLLLRERLEGMRLPGRVEAIALASEETAAFHARDLDLFPGPQTADPAELIERLCARLGDEAVRGLRPHADHRPELAWRDERTVAASPALLPPAPRPLWLLDEPRPLGRFLGDARPPLALADGPERIESGWWESRDVRRDYFVARTRDGQTLWIFRLPGSGDWHVHGIFA